MLIKVIVFCFCKSYCTDNENIYITCLFQKKNVYENMRHYHETCQNTDYFLKCRSEVKFSGMTIYFRILWYILHLDFRILIVNLLLIWVLK